MEGLRLLFSGILGALACGCAAQNSVDDIDLIEIRQSGPASLDISISSDGRGSFSIEGVGPNEKGTFKLSESEFRSFEKVLAEFRPEAVPRSDASVIEMLDRAYPEGVHSATDRGAIYIRWIGAGVDDHYLADLGCDWQRMADRNARLRSIMAGMPIHL
ncbi:MAG: hypothetical protein H6919_06200 [Sphingomonadaceae bacterium]|nr:hypothetical protein [Sphingomonadaceae bacterium]MCP5383310.1 hypothetical protein [Altererythrobacter sp.]MCP5393487.1 hypothetical protein [Sphingomonadaceae bacterium]